MILTQAPAKLNLVLEVLGRRGTYHDICSIAQTIELSDTLTFEPAPDIAFTCSEPELVADNLVVRAAQLLRREARTASGARIHLEKHIPWAAGLGGGSSDAAATLCALDRLWGLDMGLEALADLGSRLGSDVPLFLAGGTVLLEGRGEHIRRLPDHPVMHAVLLLPDAPPPSGKTGMMYSLLQPGMFTTGQFARAAEFALEHNARIPELLLFNAFEQVAQSAFPGMDQKMQSLEAAAGQPAHLSGSGPCLFSLLPSAEEAESAVARLRRRGFSAVATRLRSAHTGPHPPLTAASDAGSIAHRQRR